ncbi:MAG: putative DNA binding domain-containing protein [Rhodanobacter sp.]|jgi:ATP-dependent DNA helicase RecG|nr:putative DNA binding domain-containing protein [Rhodanobacter sp.]
MEIMSSGQQPLDLFDTLTYFEGADVEYKSARGGLPGSLWETYSAFANTSGGSIWLGVAQKNGKLEIQGIEQPQKRVCDLWNLVNNREKISRNLLKEDDIQIVPTPLPGKSLILIKVPRASRRDRPVYVGKDAFTGTYRRNYEGDYLCGRDEVRRMFVDQSDEPADSRILDGFDWNDVHPDSLRQFRNRFASARPNHPWLAEDDAGLMTRLGGWRRDRQSPREGLTVAGLLMFGREQAIRDPTALPGFQLDYRERFSDDPSVRWTDRFTLDGAWEGNLFQFYQQVIVRLGNGPGIKSPFQRDAEEGYRRTTTAVHEALQEALVNALIHADYSGQGGIVIDRYVDRLEFSNPGTLLVSREQLLRGGVSECRNKSLQQMFQMLGAGDKAGSGIDKIRTSWAAAHWQSPRLSETYRPDRVILTLSMISTLPAQITAALDQRFGPIFRDRSPDEIQALVAAEVEGEITNQRLQEMLTLHRVDITHLLRGLVLDGFLVVEGQGRGTRYFPVGRRPSQGGSKQTEDSPNSADSFLDLPATPTDLPEILTDLPETPTDLPGIPTDLPDSPREPSEDPALIALAGPVRNSGKASETTVRQTILALCRDRFLTMRDLAALLDRSVGTLRNQYVGQMVRAGLLDLRYQDTPSHRDQAYRTHGGDVNQ